MTSSAYEWLALAVKTAVSLRDVKYAHEMIKRAREIAKEEEQEHVAWLAMAAMEQVSLAMMADATNRTPRTHTEYGLVQSWFKSNHSAIFPGSSLEKIKAGRYIPDFMLKLPTGEVVPVECKKTFSQRSLTQLQAYMKHFGASQGIAVACSLKVSLPGNVVFVARPMPTQD